MLLIEIEMYKLWFFICLINCLVWFLGIFVIFVLFGLLLFRVLGLFLFCYVCFYVGVIIGVLLGVSFNLMVWIFVVIVGMFFYIILVEMVSNKI